MRRQKYNTRGASDPITRMLTNLAEGSRLNTDLLTGLANAVAAVEETQRKFRMAVLFRLSRIETLLQMVHAAQIVDAHLSQTGSKERIKEHAGGAEAYIEERSKGIYLRMLEFIYGGAGAPDARRDGGRRWSGWEI